MKSILCASRLSLCESFNSIYSNFARLIHSIPALMLLIGIPFCSTTVAQTAHFSGAVSTLGSGFSVPYGAAVDRNGNIFVADYDNRSIKEIVAVGGIVSSTSTVITVGSGFNNPMGVAVDGSGNVFVATGSDNAVKEIVAVGGVVSSASTVNTVGSGFILPYGVAVDGSGNVFVADAGLNEVKEIDLSDPPSLSFASTEVGSTSSDSPQTVTIANSGNAPLTFPVPATGNNPSISANFTLNSGGGSACPLIGSGAGSPGTLAQGTSCTLPISFTPTTFGTISGSLVLADNNLNASSPGYATQSIPLSGTATGATVILTSSPIYSYVDDQVTLTAAVAGGSGTPTGMVTFKYNGTAISDCPPVALDGTGTARCTTATLPAGTDSLTADYGGDSTYRVPKTSNTVTQTVNVSSSTTMVSSTPDTRPDWTVDQPVTFTAIVAPSPDPYPSTIVPFLQTDTVNFMDGYASITGCGAVHVSFNAAAGNASAQCTVTNFTPGRHDITATFSGDSNYISSTSSALGNTVDKAATTTTVASSSAGNSSNVNDSVTFTATVGPNPVPMLAIEVAISGSVAFYMDGSSTPISGCISTPPSYNAGTGKATATCTTTALTAAGSPHSIVARYLGDSNYNGSDNVTTPLSQMVSALATTIGVSASPSSSTSVNTAVTFTAQLAGVALTPVTPSGTVTFEVNGSSSPDCPAMTVNTSGRATCTTSRLAVGANAIIATYSGDSNFTVATAGTATHTVNALAATLGVTASPSSSTMVNDSVTFTAQLAGVAFTPVVPSGTVNFTANGSTISGCGAVSVNASGRATCTTSSLAAGSDPIAATYSGDSNFTVAAAGTMTQTVTATTATTAAIASLNYSPSSQTVSLSAR